MCWCKSSLKTQPKVYLAIHAACKPLVPRGFVSSRPDSRRPFSGQAAGPNRHDSLELPTRASVPTGSAYMAGRTAYATCGSTCVERRWAQARMRWKLTSLQLQLQTATASQHHAASYSLVAMDTALFREGDGWSELTGTAHTGLSRSLLHTIHSSEIIRPTPEVWRLDFV